MAETEIPDAVGSAAQSRSGVDPAPDPAATQHLQLGEDRLYRIDARVRNVWRTRPYERKRDDPVFRPLEVYALNPEVSKLEGGVASLSIPYEPLEVGPDGLIGSVFRISNRTNVLGPSKAQVALAQANLDAPFILMQGGYRASLSSPEFHQQMVYAVSMLTYENFCAALGRHVSWGFEPPDGSDEEFSRLTLCPHGMEAENAWYDSEQKHVIFGYFKPKVSTPIVPQGAGYLFTSVSHDVITHEISHALLDGLRPHFDIPTHAQALAFHEAFADLIAFFQHFTFRDVVRNQIILTKGRLENARQLVNIAQAFGQGLGLVGGTLRTVYNDPDATEGTDQRIVLDSENDKNEPPHRLGRVLVHAIFDAYLTLYNRKAKQYIKLATGGTGTLPEGEIPAGLEEFLTDTARNLAEHFLKICIRAVDYCPPVDVRFGDFLRAIITADYDLVPNDDWGYREAIIQSFGQRGIYGEGTTSMTEDALVWNRPTIPIEPVHDLRSESIGFNNSRAPSRNANTVQSDAGIVGRLCTRPENAAEFGLVAPESADFASGEYELPTVMSVRHLHRVGPDGQVAFDTVAEIIQKRRFTSKGLSLTIFGGSTVIFGPGGDVRYVIRKRVDHDPRAHQQRDFATASTGRAYWREENGRLSLDRDVLKKLCLSCST